MTPPRPSAVESAEAVRNPQTAVPSKDQIAADIARWLPLFFTNSDDVLEVRVIDAGRKGREVGGYMLARFIPAMAPRIAEAGAKGGIICFTPQQLNPAVLDRCRHALVEVTKIKKGDLKGQSRPPLTSDSDVIARRWVVLDIDTKRQGECSATEAEKTEAWGLATQVRDWMSTQGWPLPIVVDSGNGFHLYYSIQIGALPTGKSDQSSSDPIRQLLCGLHNKFPHPSGHKVDKVIYNPSRVMRVPGTMSRRGDATDERPHRQCKVVETPVPICSASADVLSDTLAALASHITNEDQAGPTPAAVTPPRSTCSDGTTPYGRQALASECETIRATPHGNRNNQLNTSAFKIGQLVAGSEIAEADATAALTDAAAAIQLGESEARSTIQSGFNAGKKEPRSAPHTFNQGSTTAFVTAPPGSPSPTPPTDGPATPAPSEPVKPKKSKQVPNLHDTDRGMLADHFLSNYMLDTKKKLVYWQDEFHEWNGVHYATVPAKAIEGRVIDSVEQKLLFDHLHALDSHKDDEDKPKPKLPMTTRGVVGDVVTLLRAGKRCLIEASRAPSWIGSAELANLPNPDEFVVARNGLVHLPSYAAGKSDAIKACTPEFFAFNAVDYDIDLSPPTPSRWLAFLNEVWPNEPDSIDLLQEWFGYLLTSDTRQQKMLWLIGRSGGGKGTICKVVRALVGAANVASPSLGGLTAVFGLEPLYRKSVALVGDVRLDPKDRIGVEQLLLQIVGEDCVQVNRKNISSVSLKMPTRFVIQGNAAPQLSDESGAMERRTCLLRFTQTFQGREDKDLLVKLLPELPGIFKWAIEGWSRLQKNGTFTVPQSSANYMSEMAKRSRPIARFVADCCEIHPDAKVPVSDLYDAYKTWHKSENQDDDSATPIALGAFLAALIEVEPSIGAKAKQRRIGGKRPKCYEGIRLRADRGNDDDESLTSYERTRADSADDLFPASGDDAPEPPTKYTGVREEEL